MTDWNELALFAMFAGVALKSTVVLGAAWLGAILMRGRSAAARHLLWTAAASAVLALPFLSVMLPILPVPVAGALLPDVNIVFRAAATAHPDSAVLQGRQQSIAPAPVQPARWRPDWRLSLMLLWAAGAAAA